MAEIKETSAAARRAGVSLEVLRAKRRNVGFFNAMVNRWLIEKLSARRVVVDVRWGVYRIQSARQQSP
jgi:hypothetical protein